MHNWSTDTTKLTNPAQKQKWEFEQLINYGLNGQKLNQATLRDFWSTLEIDPTRRRFLDLLLNA